MKEDKLMALENEKLIEMAKAGNKEAEESLIEKNKDFIKNFTIKGKPVEIVGLEKSDIEQELRIAFWKAIESYDGRTKFLTYARKCMENRIFDVSKSYTKRNEDNQVINNLSLYGEDGESLDIEEKNSGVEARFVAKEISKNIEQELQIGFSRLEKMVYEAMLNGKKNKEIAQELGKDVKSIENTKSRIKEKIFKARGE
ncbi:MAG: sigma-70 family RNA polymerase sigma factor [Clostridia bacterium]|nr:sigma-70 family RNA polymerase sigma factor [Clostridia bacterium]